MKATQLSLDMDYRISKEQACILCHLSSDVKGVVLNAKLKTKMGVVMGKYALNLKEHEANYINTHLSTSLPNSNDFLVKYRKHLKTKK